MGGDILTDNLVTFTRFQQKFLTSFDICDNLSQFDRNVNQKRQDYGSLNSVVEFEL